MSQTFNLLCQQMLVFSHYFQVLQEFRPFPAPSLSRGWIRSSLFSKGLEPKHWGWRFRLMSPGSQALSSPGPRGEEVCHVPPFSTGKGCGQGGESETLHREPPELPGKSPQRDLRAGKVFGELLPTGRVSGRQGCLWNMPSFSCDPLPAS